MQTPQMAAPGSTLFNLGQSGPRTVISAYPLPMELELRHEGSKRYKIEAAPKGEIRVLTVNDTFGINKNFSSGQYWAAPIPASVVADNLVQAWAKGRVGNKEGVGPGVLVCKELVPDAAEIETVMGLQEAYYRFLVNDADLKNAHDQVKHITDEHRIAADWMGVKDRAWAKKMERIDMQRCPACAEEIRETAKVCRFCNVHIAEFLEKETKREKLAQVRAEAKPKE